MSANQPLASTISSHLSEITLSPLGYDISPFFLNPVYAPKSTAPSLTMIFIIINSHPQSFIITPCIRYPTLQPQCC